LIGQHYCNARSEITFNYRGMENEIDIKLFFWLGTVILLASVLSVVIIVLLYRNKLFRMKKEESEKLLKISLASEQQERKRIASDLIQYVFLDSSF